MSLPATLEAHTSILSPEEMALARALVEDRQSHLFAGWEAPGTNDAAKHAMLAQARALDASYPGGLRGYTSNARALLESSRAGKNPFEGFVPGVPRGEQLAYGSEQFVSYEKIGLPEVSDSAFVLVAGGLGERLGYSGIKVALTSESCTGSCFLRQYIESILQLSRASNAAAGRAASGRTAELAIMTSGDTHERTVRLLEEHNYFGMPRSSLTIIRQEKVPCLMDNDAKLALEPGNPYELQTKPHGHGDVHALLLKSGLLDKWLKDGRRWVLLFQDTNSLFFKAVASALGVSKSQNYEVNSLAVPRKAKEAIGAICELVNKAQGTRITVNVEYNQLDPLLRATTSPQGDAPDPATGNSPYPGNINEIVLALEPYAQTLRKTLGLTPEFVNPKYADSTRTAFLSTARLECMMQDYPRSLGPDARVGFTVLDTWVAFSPVKNNPKDAAAKAKAGQPPASAASGELDQYAANSRILRMAGANVAAPAGVTYNGVPLELWPRVVLSTAFAPSFDQLRGKVGSGVEVSQRSVLIVEGADVRIKSLKLDGTLVIRASGDATVVVDGLEVRNKGWRFEPVSWEDKSLPEDTRVRGFRVVKDETATLEFTKPGMYVVDAHGTHTK
eukprot:m51a1_g6868 putative udp-sugar pyrophosphorylase-like (617) ;mRNA; f:161448-163945